MLVIFDLDQTLADNSHRIHLAESGNTDWTAFHAQCFDDLPNAPLIEIAQLLDNGMHYIAIITSRPESVRSHTTKWLNKYHIGYDSLHMRDDDDARNSVIIKKEIFEQNLSQILQEHEIALAFDDDKALVDMWREMGITACQVDKDDFQYTRGNRLKNRLRNKRKRRFSANNN